MTQQYFVPNVTNMSLRDWLAGMVMQGLVAHHGLPYSKGSLTNTENLREFSEYAYQAADMLIEERGKS